MNPRHSILSTLRCSSLAPATRRLVPARAMSSTPVGHDPSQMKGHVQWIKGVASEKIGTMTGSPKWKASGAHARAEGITEMRMAKAAGDKKVAQKLEHGSPGILKASGGSQGVLGKMFGCEGMQERGSAKVEAGTRKASGGPYE